MIPLRRATALLALLALPALAACNGDGPADPPAEAPTLEGTWVASADPVRQGFFPEASTFRIVLPPPDAGVQGTWGATGASGVVVKPDQAAAGFLEDDGEVRIGLQFDRYAHGCVGPSSQCYLLWYRFVGEFQGPNTLVGKVLPPPHPTLPDSEIAALAEWTLVRAQ